MDLTYRLGSLAAFVFCFALFAGEWLLRTRLDFIHPVALLSAGGGVALGLMGLISPEKIKLTADKKLQPLANTVCLFGMGLGGCFWFLIK